jgi:hypothetical protein
VITEMYEIEVLRTLWDFTRGRIERVRTERGGEGGWSVVEIAIWVGLFAAAAIVVGAILVRKATDKANSVQTQ